MNYLVNLFKPYRSIQNSYLEKQVITLIYHISYFVQPVCFILYTYCHITKLYYAVVLMHLGRETQAIDYLDFLQEDAPILEGYGKAHTYALLSILYENKGAKYKHMQDAVDIAFQHVREEEMPFLLEYGERKDFNAPTSKHNFITFKTSKIWEALALQALSKGEYVFAAEMLKQVLILNHKFIFEYA
jgi:hypothetical protein